MPTIKQRKAIERIVENGGNISRAMLDVNYSPATAHTPQKLTESKGFKELCEEYGLTDDFLIRALIDDIRDKPKNRKAELELAFKVKGNLSDKEENKQTFVQIKNINYIVPNGNNTETNIQATSSLPSTE